MYDRRFADAKFLESEKGPKWSGRLLQDFELLLAKVPKPNYAIINDRGCALEYEVNGSVFVSEGENSI